MAGLDNHWSALISGLAWKASPAATARKWSGGEWRRVAHLDYISDRVAALWARPLRLIVSLPPRHGKSELISHWTPVHALAVDASKRIAVTSYEQTLAALYSRKIRATLMASPGIGAELSRDRAAATEWETMQGGGVYAAGVGGALTGRGFDLLIIDDPIKNRADADSPTIRRRVWEWYRSTARTRLEPDASIIVVMTRWHEGDLVGKLLGNRESGDSDDSEFGDDWEHLRFPALAEDDDVLGREEGSALWPERYDSAYLRGARFESGPQEFAALYQQRPVRQGGAIFLSDWWRFHETLPEPTRGVIQFWDTAFKTGQENDYSACATMYDAPPDYALLNMFRRRMDFPALVRAVIAQAERYQPVRIYVEDAASGQSLAQTMGDRALVSAIKSDAPRLPIVPVRVDADKVARANAVTGYIEAGNVLLPERADWLPMFLHEATEFPRGEHDDMVDAFVGALDQLKKQSARSGGIMAWEDGGYRYI